MQFKGLGVTNKYFCNASNADVYTSALLAGAMKPLKVLSKFENHFAIKTVHFQVQLEADGYFLHKIFKFATAASRASWYQLASFDLILQIRLQKRLLGFAQTQYSAHKLCRLRILTDAIA